MLWTLGRIGPTDRTIDEWFVNTGYALSANAHIQSIRIAGHRARHFQPEPKLPAFVRSALIDSEPRVRFAAVQAIQQARQSDLVGALCDLAAQEMDRVTWPSKPELIKATRMIVVFSIILGLAIGLMDWLLQELLVKTVARLAR